MIRGFYTAASGMVAQSLKQDTIANNIANAGTAGFKRQRFVAESDTFAQALDQRINALSVTNRTSYPDSPVSPVLVNVGSQLDLSEGSIRVTGNAFDFAIEGPGSFEVVDSNGTRQTRGGDFRLNSDRELVTADGAKVQGRSGSIKLAEGKIGVAEDGTVSVDGNQVDKIKLVGVKPGETRVVQGSLEEANISVVRELTDMITNMRSFEANQRMIGNLDRTLDKLINEAGRV